MGCADGKGDEAAGIIVAKDSKYKTFTDIIEDAKAHPGTVKYSETGTGGLPWTVSAFIQDVTGASFNQVPYDSDAAAKNAVLNGECDFTVCLLQQGLEESKAGDLRFLAVFSKTPDKALPGVPVIINEFPGFEKYLPWGAFYGVFAKKGTNKAIIDKLAEAFKAAAPNETYQNVLKNFDVNFMGATGEEAAAYVSNWRKNTVQALKNSGILDD